MVAEATLLNLDLNGVAKSADVVRVESSGGKSAHLKQSLGRLVIRVGAVAFRFGTSKPVQDPLSALHGFKHTGGSRPPPPWGMVDARYALV